MFNPLISKVKLPGKVFQLPSKGLFYSPGVLAENVKDGEIQVKPMSALAEIKIRSADLLLSGKILQEVCEECIPEILRPDALTTKDVDALFVFLVISTYGSDKKIHASHTCDNAQWHDYTISLENIVMKPRNECLDHREVMYQTVLNNGQTVLLKPLTFEDSIAMMNLRQAIIQDEQAGKKLSSKHVEVVMISELIATIAGVEDKDLAGNTVRITDRVMIEEWLRALSRKQTEQIVKAANSASEWGFDFNVKLTCKDCGEEYVHELELNPINFFSE